MYPLLRSARVILSARRRTPLGIDETSSLRLRAGLGDIDPFLELNNARHLNMFELGRWDYSVRIGFFALMRKHKWGVVIGGASVRYRRRIPAFARYELRTRMVCHDQRWFYFLQETWRHGKICSSGLLKAGVRDSSGLVAATTVIEAMNQPEWGHEIPPWIQAWIDAEAQRPWPASSA